MGIGAGRVVGVVLPHPSLSRWERGTVPCRLDEWWVADGDLDSGFRGKRRGLVAGETAKNEQGNGDGDAKQEEIRRPVKWECRLLGGIGRG